jgi:hypothetical protein
MRSRRSFTEIEGSSHALKGSCNHHGMSRIYRIIWIRDQSEDMSKEMLQ